MILPFVKALVNMNLFPLASFVKNEYHYQLKRHKKNKTSFPDIPAPFSVLPMRMRQIKCYNCNTNIDFSRFQMISRKSEGK